MDHQQEGPFSRRPHYLLRKAYFDAVWRAGGLPVALPYVEEAMENFLSLCHGLILPGGTYPFPEQLYELDAVPNKKNNLRYQFEAKFTRCALNSKIPLLGICAGMQIIAAVKGATFYRDVRTELPTDIDHLNASPAETPAHDISVIPETLLRRVLKVDRLKVNTAHKEAIRGNFSNLTISARAPDGVIEGIEIPNHHFCIGVQWHPEFFARKGDPNLNLFTALITAAKSEETK